MPEERVELSRVAHLYEESELDVLVEHLESLMQLHQVSE